MKTTLFSSAKPTKQTFKPTGTGSARQDPDDRGLVMETPPSVAPDTTPASPIEKGDSSSSKKKAKLEAEFLALAKKAGGRNGVPHPKPTHRGWR